MDITENYKEKLLDISINNGIRIEIPKKRQKCISLKYLNLVSSNILAFFNSGKSGRANFQKRVSPSYFQALLGFVLGY